MGSMFSCQASAPGPRRRAVRSAIGCSGDSHVQQTLVQRRRAELALASALHPRAGARTALSRNGVPATIVRHILRLLRSTHEHAWYHFPENCVVVCLESGKHSMYSPGLWVFSARRRTTRSDAADAAACPEPTTTATTQDDESQMTREFRLMPHMSIPSDTTIFTIYKERLRAFMSPFLAGYIVDYSPEDNQWTYVENTFARADDACLSTAMRLASEPYTAATCYRRYTVIYGQRGDRIRCIAFDNKRMRWLPLPPLPGFNATLRVDTCRSRSDRSTVYVCAADVAYRLIVDAHAPPQTLTTVLVARTLLDTGPARTAARRQWVVETLELRNAIRDDDQPCDHAAQDAAPGGHQPLLVVADGVPDDGQPCDDATEDVAPSLVVRNDTSNRKRRRSEALTAVGAWLLGRDGRLYCVYTRPDVEEKCLLELFKRSPKASKWHQLVVWDFAAWQYADVDDPAIPIPTAAELFPDRDRMAAFGRHVGAIPQRLLDRIAPDPVSPFAVPVMVHL
jgi:hypothetical protein